MMSAWNRRFLMGAFLFVAMQPAWAVRVANDIPRPAAADTARSAPRNGTISGVDLGRNTIVIDGVAYLFSPMSVVMHASDSSKRSPLNLAQGDRIQFTVTKEAAANRERVTEIWLLETRGKPR